MRLAPLARVIALASLLGLPSARAAAPSAQVDYHCGNASAVRVLYDNSAPEQGRPLAWVHDGAQTHRLPLVRSASGARYSDGHWTWWSKGDDARFERKGKPAVNTCKATGSRRVLIDRRTRTQWLLPATWTAERVGEEVLTGAQAEAEQPGAQLVARYSEQPATPGSAPQTLARLMVLPTQRWTMLAEPSAATIGELLSKTPTWSTVASLPAANPYPSDSPEAQAFDALLPTLDRMRDDLHLWGQGPAPDSCHITGSVSYRERMALAPGDMLEVQLLDVSLADAPAKVLAERRRRVGSHPVPLRFELPCDPQAYEPQARLVVSARIVRNGHLLFASDTQQPVLTEGHGREVELMLERMRGKPAKPSRENSR